MKNRKLFKGGIFLLLILTIAFLFLAFYEPDYNGSINLSSSGDILLFAHRGFGNHAPDNSLVGAKLALREGLNGVDVDAQFSKDKQTIIFHDVSLERFTDGEGRVDSYTLEELQKYDLGKKFGDGTQFNNVQIESFETFIKEVTPEALLMVELKIATIKDTGMERQVIDILERYDAFDKVFISTFNPMVLYRLKQIDERVKTVFIFQDSGWDAKRVEETKEEDRVSLPWYLQKEWTRRIIRKIAKPDALSINEKVAENTIDNLKQNGWPIFLWPLNDEESIRWGIVERPYGIVTDEPILTKEIYTSYEAD
ncbi:MAG: glycerophosphodiester phosphodiesterase family protein [Candidatus Paceibacterota bacterium]